MGGKSEIANHVVPTPTQEQLAIAQITQDSATFDGEKAAFQKMVRQVMEATKCNQNTAEIALFDSGNNVEDAVLAIIEREGDQDSWTESKNRKTKKSEASAHAAEEKENFVEKRERGQGFRGGRRGRSERPDRTDRDNRENRDPRPDGTERNERPERQEKFDRGDRGNRSGRGRGATTRGGRGGGGGRGGSTRPPRRDRDQAGEGGFSVTTWDNNMQNNKDEDALNGDNEELNWSNTPLVFSRREPQQQPQQSQPVQTYSSASKQQEPAKPMSFAAAAAMRKKVEVVQPTPGPIEPPQRSYEKECQPSPSVSPQKPYQQSSIFGNSGSSYGKDLSLDGPLHGTDSLNISRGSANDQIGGLTFTNRAHAQSQQSYQTDTVQNLTNQLKNDLGISISAPTSGVTTASTVANLLSSFQPSSVDAKQPQQSQQQQSRFAPTPQSNFNSTSTVEFVTGGGDVGSTLAEYQFGWGAESSPTSRENDVDNFKQAANSFLSSTNTQTEISPKRLEIDHALSKLNHIDVSPARSTAPASATQPTSYAPASHQTNGHPQQPAQTQQQAAQEQLSKLRAGSGLSYANTSTLSYPGTTTTKPQTHSQHILTITDPNTQRQTQIPQQQPQQATSQTQSYQSSQSTQQQAQQQQQHHQQVQQSPAQPQQQTQTQQQMSQAPLYPQAQNFAAYSNPYMNSYMNLYSPVTAGMRTDDAAMAATFLGYPFMNQMDIASLTAMLPPAMASATASTAQAPPPTIQSHLQHQQHNQQQQHRSDQHYDMPKTYSNQNLGAVTMANTTNLAQAQQRTTMDNSNSSAVPPPPGFTGPPSNIPTATALFQPNLSSLFQMPGSYAPNLSPFPLMFPGSTPQHKLPATMFPQQTMDDTMNMNDMRMNTAQKIYGQGQQDKYGVPNGGAKDRGLNMGGAQPTPPPQLSGNYAPAYGGGVGGMQNMGLPKKNPYHWNA